MMMTLRFKSLAFQLTADIFKVIWLRLINNCKSKSNNNTFWHFSVAVNDLDTAICNFLISICSTDRG